MSIAPIQNPAIPVALQTAPQAAPYNALPGQPAQTLQGAEESPATPIPAESVSQQAEVVRSAETAKLGAQVLPSQQPAPQSAVESRAQLDLRQLDVDPVKPSPRYAIQAYESAARSRSEDSPGGGLDGKA